jgi:hypothetical protein
MIVKIQRSQPPSKPGLVLVYDQSGIHCWSGPINSRVDKWMRERQKVFAHAHIDCGEIVIDREAPWQSW